MKRAGSVLIVCVIGVLATDVRANGYKILGVKSAKANGMGEAFIVQADDPSAIAFNPAGLAQLRGNQANIHATVCNGYTEHTSPSGVKTDNEDGWQTVPSLFVTSDFGYDSLAAGLGMSFPNGLSSEWSQNSFARYTATYSDLVVADISPALGARVTERLMIGGALDFLYSEARLKRMADMGLASGAPGTMDMEIDLKGDGNAWGFNMGLIYEFTPMHAVAATYRHPVSIDYDGDLTVAGVSRDITATIDFPAVIVLGYAFRPSDTWKIEFNADWTDWDSVDDITIDFDAAGVPDEVQKQTFRDTLAYKLGLEHQHTENVALRCGYIYNENATSEATWRPSLTDTDTHFITGGLGWKVDKTLTIDAALQLVHYEKRSIDNNVDNNELFSSSSIDGTYRTWAPCLSLAALYRF